VGVQEDRRVRAGEGLLGSRMEAEIEEAEGIVSGGRGGRSGDLWGVRKEFQVSRSDLSL
jgi:hypothetical protein